MAAAIEMHEARRSAVQLGFATAVAQALLLREAMAAMGGSEAAWGVVMAGWLGGMAAGARIGVAVGGAASARWAPVLVLALAASGVLLLRAAPALVGAAPGEALTTASTFWVWLAAVLPSAAVGGLAFPILAGLLGPAGAGRAYALDAAGALVGGALLSCALLVLPTATTLCAAWGLTAAATLWPRNRAAAALVAAAALAASWPAAGVLARAGWHWSGHPGELGRWVETRYQQLALSAGRPISLYADGGLLASYPDPYGALPRAHLVMLLHPDPRRVVAIGAAAGGAVEAMVRHPVEHLRVAEDDPGLLRHLPEWYGDNAANVLARPEVEVFAGDPLRAVTAAEPWDLVLLLDGDPTTLRRNRTRSREFLLRCRSQMAPDGILVMRVGVADTYLGGAGGRLLSVLAATLRGVFGQVAALPGEEVLLVAGGPDAEISLDPEALAGRWTARGIDAATPIREMIPLLVDPARAADLQAQLDPTAPPNTVRHPRAVLLASGLHEGRGRPTLLWLVRRVDAAGRLPAVTALATVALLVLLAARVRRRTATVAAGVLGFCSMGWWLLLLASWQASRGSVYSEVGALTALFMAGLAAGGGAAQRWRRPARPLPLLLASGVVLSLLIASGAALEGSCAIIVALLGTAGLLTGMAFPGLAVLGGADPRHGAGVAFAADEAGAALSALAVGVLLVPSAGLANTAVGLAVLQLATLPAVIGAARGGPR